MDYLTELENELAGFTQMLFQGVSEIQLKGDSLDQISRNKLINSLSTDLLNSHAGVLSSIGKIPDEIFTVTRESQENEVKMLELKYEQAVNRLERLKNNAKNVFQCLEENLDSLS